LFSKTIKQPTEIQSTNATGQNSPKERIKSPKQVQTTRQKMDDVKEEVCLCTFQCLVTLVFVLIHPAYVKLWMAVRVLSLSWFITRNVDS